MGGWLQALIGRLEDRIAAVTTIPRHRDEEPIYVHRITPQEDDPNIHHDKANKEYVIHLYYSSTTVLQSYCMFKSQFSFPGRR